MSFTINTPDSRLPMFHLHPVSQWPEWLTLLLVALLNIGVDIV
jgi:hypothetical protein